MTTQIYINLPVKNLQISIAFFTKLGFTFNSEFTNENATCMIIGENIFAMLLVEKFFQTFTNKTICDASKSIEVLLCISRESRADVDDMVKNAVAAGGIVPRPAQDHGFMYTHAFEDTDGHTWELVYMAPATEPKI
jgi:uncharacterized protein